MYSFLLLLQNWCILYLHGISNNRGYDHRVGLYKVLLAFGYRVLAVDYRGFGDSSGIIVTEETVVEDARAAIEWLRNKIDESEKLLVWGHSLGAAIACRAVAEEDIEHNDASGIETLFLESPFNNLHDEVMDAVFSSQGRILTAIGKLLPIRKQLKKAKMQFLSDVWIREIACPTVIIHAEDDDTININLARKLFKAAVNEGKHNIDMITVDRRYGLGHNDIYRYHNMQDILTNKACKN